MGLTLSLGCHSGPSALTLTAEHRAAVARTLKARHLSEPDTLTSKAHAYVTADYIVSTLVQQPRDFGTERLLAIREALLPFGFKYYEVNVNGPVNFSTKEYLQRFGSARYDEGRKDGKKLEWVEGLGPSGGR